MENVLTCLLSVSIFIIIYAFVKLKEHSKERELYYLVAWCVTIDSCEHRCNLRLTDYIHKAQIQEDIPQKYRITGDEWDVVNEIVGQFQKVLVQNYFNGRLSAPKSKYVIPGEHYFMFKLALFLEKHQCDYEFLDHNMHKDTLDYRRYGDWGGPLYDATYSLTEFAITYHKLYYIACEFCRSSKIFNLNGDSFQSNDSIKEILDSKQISVSRY